MIEKAQAIHYKTILNIADVCFGKGYYDESLLKSKQYSTYIFKNPKNINQIIGFCTYKICDMSALEILCKPLNKKVGMIQTLAFLPTYRSKGFGSELLRFVCEKTKGLYCTEIYYLAWAESKQAYFEQKLMKLGFNLKDSINNYWLHQSLNTQFICIRCGQPPCKCTLNVYLLNQ